MRLGLLARQRVTSDQAHRCGVEIRRPRLHRKALAKSVPAALALIAHASIVATRHPPSFTAATTVCIPIARG